MYVPVTPGASLMKQEYLQVQWKSGVKQSSDFCTWAVNIINTFMVNMFAKRNQDGFVEPGKFYFIRFRIYGIKWFCTRWDQ